MTETHAIKGGQHRGREVEFGWAEETGLQAQVHEGWVAFGPAAEALAVDCGLSVERLVARLQRADAAVSSAAATLGRKGGRAKSERKAAAVRENGRKGGRPRKAGLYDATYHRDGSATVWLVYQQVWRRVYEVAGLSDEEWAARDSRERERLERHLTAK